MGAASIKQDITSAVIYRKAPFVSIASLFMLYLYDKNTMAVSIEQFNTTISITYRSLREGRFLKVPAWISVILFSERSLKTERRKKI